MRIFSSRRQSAPGVLRINVSIRAGAVVWCEFCEFPKKFSERCPILPVRIVTIYERIKGCFPERRRGLQSAEFARNPCANHAINILVHKTKKECVKLHDVCANYTKSGLTFDRFCNKKESSQTGGANQCRCKRNLKNARNGGAAENG